MALFWNLNITRFLLILLVFVLPVDDSRTDALLAVRLFQPVVSSPLLCQRYPLRQPSSLHLSLWLLLLYLTDIIVITEKSFHVSTPPGKTTDLIYNTWNAISICHVHRNTQGNPLKDHLSATKPEHLKDQQLKHRKIWPGAAPLDSSWSSATPSLR